MLDLAGEARNFERSYQERRGLALRQRRDELRRMPGERAAMAFHVLHIITGEGQLGERQTLRNGLRDVQRIVNRHRAFGLKRAKQPASLFRRYWVGERFEKGVAARYVAECLDLERHM